MRFLYLTFALVFILFHVVAGQDLLCELLGGTCQFPATRNCANGEIRGVSCGSNGICCLDGQEVGLSNGNSTDYEDSDEDLPDSKPRSTDEPPLCTLLGGFCQGPITANCAFGEITNIPCGPNERCCRRGQ
ncbi:uncharacterized protein LOC144327140 [Podarcis muralis]